MAFVPQIGSENIQAPDQYPYCGVAREVAQVRYESPHRDTAYRLHQKINQLKTQVKVGMNTDDAIFQFKALTGLHSNNIVSYKEEYGRYARRSGRMEYANKESERYYPYSKYYDEYERPGRNRYYELEYEYGDREKEMRDRDKESRDRRNTSVRYF